MGTAKNVVFQMAYKPDSLALFCQLELPNTKYTILRRIGKDKQNILPKSFNLRDPYLYS